MKMKKKILSVILSLSLAVAPFSQVSASEVSKSQSEPIVHMEEQVESVVQNVVSYAENKASLCEVTDTLAETPVTTETPVVTETPTVTESPTQAPTTTPTVTYYNEDGKAVKVLTPFYYTKRSQLEKLSVNYFDIKVSASYEKDVVIPVKVKSKGALVYVLVDSYTAEEMSNYRLYSDAACTKSIYTSNNVAYVPKAGTYYIKLPHYYLYDEQDTMMLAGCSFVSGSDVQLKNKVEVISAIVKSSTPIYYKVVTTKPTKLTFTVTADWSATVTLCNSKKKAITNDTYLYSSDTEKGAKTVYVVGKGTYYFKVKSSQGVIATKAVLTTVSNASGTSKAKAGTLKVNGKTRSVLMLLGETTKRNYYFKFYNPKKQKIFVNVTSSFSSGKAQFQFYDSKGDCFGTRYIYDGINEKNSYQTYVSSYGSSVKTLPKGTYYVKFNKVDNKTSGILQVKITTK